MPRNNRCQGITRKGIPCMNKVINGFCHIHKNQAPRFANPGMELYPSSGLPYWAPSLMAIKQKVLFYDNLPEMILFARESFAKLVLTSTRSFFTLSLLVIAETFKSNRVLLGPNDIDEIIDIVSDRLVEIPPFEDYTQDFKRKCHQGIRQEARNKVACFYFRGVEGLCLDVIEKIIRFV